ncbi:MAG: linear amide C-N hydrolase [Proteobacteria bacterium]|nr:linear amide C-N hydrolase [Pseudomonadota bacterium]MBU4470116.1 linear amide C-N hydrolase [Pseudomonadota bacterium]MCG2753100.1 linear amide C-N hydrolase [Desulfobacteraceae bacterium]
MKTGIPQLILGILFPCLMQQDVRACSSFKLTDADHVLVGFNLDTLAGDGLIVVNKRGVSKTAMQPIKDIQLPETGQPARWTSKYGSITFNQYGRELPFVGMNEAGLIVNTLANPKGKFPEPDSRPSIWSGQWVQYQLDNFATVHEVITSDAQLRIKRTKGLVPGTHYFITDKDGNCAVIEFINGKQICYINETLPYNVVTNSTYPESIKCLNRNKIPWRDQGKSIERFVRAVKMVKSYDPEGTTSLLDYSFDILKSVSWSENRKLGPLNFTMETKWSIVYDVTYIPHPKFRFPV